MEIKKSVSFITAAITFISLGFTPFNNAIAKKTSEPVAHQETESTAHEKSSSKPTEPAKKISTPKSTAHENSNKTQTTEASKNKVPTASASVTTATNTINKNFDSWAGRGATLTPKNLVDALSNPNITNREEAALLGAIADRVNSLSTWSPSSLSVIDQKLKEAGYTGAFPASSYPDGKTWVWEGMTVTLTPVKHSNPLTYTTHVSFTQKQLLADINAKNSKLYGLYAKAVTNLNNSYSSTGVPKLGYGSNQPLTSSTHLMQGPVGDCYFVSAVNGVLQTNPQALEQMIKPDAKHPDWFTVKFPGDTKSILVKLTPAEVAAASQVVGGGVWLAVLSNAEAQYRASHSGDADRTDKHEGSLDMLHGGSEEQTFPLLTGLPYQTVSLKKQSSTALGNGFQAMVANEPQMSAHPGYYAINPQVGINTSGHALLIVGYDPTTQSLLILNPWGSTGYYNPPSMKFSSNLPTKEPQNGNWYSMQNGLFTAPISQLQSNDFVGMTIPNSAANYF
ncbi:MAG: C2 family cysteine protease [Gammaproteobacteria bacterium]|nr:C2 family cysteine protease [Gammaproteobacteria bacterium]